MGRLKLFLLRGSLIDLAVGVSIGAAFGALVIAIVDDFLAPLLGIVLGSTDFSSLAFQISGAKFVYGDFITKLITFSIIGLVVYVLVIVPFTKLVDRFQPGATELGPVRECPLCRSTVHRDATVCSFCCRDIEPVDNDTVTDQPAT